MQTVERKNGTVGESLDIEFKDPESYAKLVIDIVLFILIIIVYTFWILVITINIKNRVRKLRQLKANILVSREEEERQRLNLYNEETHIVKESYLLTTCICEFCFAIVGLAMPTYALLKRHWGAFHNISEYCILRSTTVSDEELIVMLLRGVTWVFLHIVILLVCSLMRYLIDRYLFYKTYNRLTILGYGVLSCVFIMLFFNKYTYYYRILASFVFVFDLFLFLRYRTKLSLVLIGRVREIQQCYGNCRRYQLEYGKYVSFRGFSFLFCLGMLITFLADWTRLVMSLVTNPIYPCKGSVHLNMSHSLGKDYPKLLETIIHYFLNVIYVGGQILIFAPCYIYTFYRIICSCVTRFKKQPSFHDEIITPLIERYHRNIMS